MDRQGSQVAQEQGELEGQNLTFKFLRRSYSTHLEKAKHVLAANYVTVDNNGSDLSTPLLSLPKLHVLPLLLFSLIYRDNE